MRVLLNGEVVQLAERATVAEAVRATGAAEAPRGVAVAVEGEVVSRSEWEHTVLGEGVRVEVVQAVQGG